MKKIISLIAATAMFAAIAGTVMADNNNPAVYVNNSEIGFADQPAVILDDRTLVPARGVFEAMDASVSWDGEARQVEIESKDHNTLVRLVIDNNEMKVYDLSAMFATLLSGQDFHAPETIVKLDVAPQILNDRTMIPLRAISEALDADVEWDGAAYAVRITTLEGKTVNESNPGYYLTASADTVAEGETVDVYVTAKNIPANTYVTGVTAVVKYNPESFEFIGSEMVKDGTKIDGVVGIDNPELTVDSVKVVYSNINKDTASTEDGAVVKLTFKSKNGGEGAFTLSNGYKMNTGYQTTLLTAAFDERETLKMYKSTDFNIDYTPVVVNASAVE